MSMRTMFVKLPAVGDAVCIRDFTTNQKILVKQTLVDGAIADMKRAVTAVLVVLKFTRVIRVVGEFQISSPTE
jgi:hypothetical protein